ncbi:PfkB family carbohydrate kinase, partial [Dokdonella sp.]|uniref:PfkB family carbohydrate kinase n=1 Tax=Dokdonella sp. TaxID=2291710 RepID=UPI003C567A35
GLACEWLMVDEVPTAAAGIVVNAEGANQIVVNLAANEHLSTTFLESHAAHLAGARVLLVQLESNLGAVRSALDLGGKYGLLRMLNPAPMHAGVDASFLRCCEVITPNETEFVHLLERIADLRISAVQVADTSDEILHGHCRKLGLASCVITLGSHGCFISHDSSTLRGDEKPCYRLPAETVQAIDTTGAGDAFSGALAASLADRQTRSFRDAVLYANRVAAMSTEKLGAAVAIPSKADVIQRFGQ